MQDDALNTIYTLPIYAQRDEIIKSVDQNQVTIITAETGAGKSTQVPQYLAEAGYKKVIITQPRILAARNLSARVRQEYSWRQQADCTNLVGYRTAHEQDDSPDNIILYCTDGLQLVRELSGSGIKNKQVLILDEIHEWNENMEVLLAWSKKRCQEEPHFKLVLMSATIESQTLAKFFGNYMPIMVPGRSFAVEFSHSKDLYAAIELELATPSANILVFLPGKAEIEQAMRELRLIGVKIPIIPLHSQLDQDEQQKAFMHHENGKIVLATNIAQTSITIDDIDIVIDSGLERRIEIKNGVEGLFISETSKADCLQRAGRAGRTKAGKYILARLSKLPCSSFEARADYGIPEIMRKHIDRLVLRLASAGLDIEQLEFFHAPSKGAIKQAKRTLASLGALKNGELTDVGKKMERFPVESTYARMLVEAQKLPKETQAKLATVIAIQEVGGIVKGGPRNTGWQAYTKQKKSDLLAQYDVMLHVPELSDFELEPYGIIAKNVDKVVDVESRLWEVLGIARPEVIDDIQVPVVRKSVTPEEEISILKCIVAGQLHQLWTVGINGEAIHIATKQKRELSSTTLVRRSGLCAGTPFDLEVASFDGLGTLHLVNDLTAVDPSWLAELAPDDYKVSSGKIYYDPYLGTLAEPVFIKHQGLVVDAGGSPVLGRTIVNQKLFAELYSAWVNQHLQKERLGLHGSIERRLLNVTLKNIEERVRHIARGAISTVELPKKNRIQLASLTKLVTWHGEEALRERHEKRFSGHHPGRKHGWMPKQQKKDRWRNHQD